MAKKKQKPSSILRKKKKKSELMFTKETDLNLLGGGQEGDAQLQNLKSLKQRLAFWRCLFWLKDIPSCSCTSTGCGSQQTRF